MDVCVNDVLSRCRPKVKALLRLKPFYSTSDLVRQFKTHILPLLEGCTAAIYHASDSVLQPLDHVLSSFASKLNLSPAEAFLTYNLAPLCARRDISMLGLIHKCVLGIAPAALKNLFPLKPSTTSPHATRFATSLHPYQLVEINHHTDVGADLKLNRWLQIEQLLFNLKPSVCS